ncbi:5554_t:CDS:2, partial [Funneliformis geosporum]
MLAKDLEEVLKSNFFNEDITRILRNININWEVAAWDCGHSSLKVQDCVSVTYKDCGRSYDPNRWQLEDCGHSSLEVQNCVSVTYEDCNRSYDPDRWQLRDYGHSSLEVWDC